MRQHPLNPNHNFKETKIMIISIYNTKFIIYKHTNNITNKSYIGKTVEGISRRWNKHLSESKRNEDNFKFPNAIRKYGADCWEHEILYYCANDDDQHLYEVEKQLISDWNTYHNGYNSDGGGNGFRSGINHPMYGKKHSEETKRKMSTSTSGSNNYRFVGYYKFNQHKYPSSKGLSEHLDVSDSSVRKWCKCNFIVISNKSYTDLNFLQSLGTRDEIVGKTFADIGFSFESII